MAATINTNINSITAQRNLTMSQASLSTSMQRLSSGLRINSAKDDAAGLAIADRFTSQIRGLTQAGRNANDGISLAQTAEGALGSISTNLQRMRELAVQSANATNSSSDRAALQLEVSQLASEIDRVATQTQFNGINLLDGSFTNKAFQVGANAGQTISITSVANARSSALGQFQGFSLSNQAIGTASNTAGAETVAIGGTTYSLGTIAVDAKAIAGGINNANISGMSATANAAVVNAVAAGASTTAGTATLALNGITINLTATTSASTNVANAIAAINAQSAATGVTAIGDSSGVKLTSLDGRNIDLGTVTAGTATLAAGNTDFGLAAAGVTGGTINITYAAPTGITGAVDFSNTAMTVPDQTIGASGTAVNAIDISTVAGANAALPALDAALSTVNTARASLGAVQNRFTSTIENLATTTENLSASRSRIQDADFAQETANLSRSQILQQAGTAMVAQANQLPQGVLALLR
jgi:flagellin